MIAMLLLKATVVIALAALVQACLGRRMSAATRHWMWTLAVAGLLALPIAARALPEWTVEVPVVPLEAVAPMTADASTLPAVSAEPAGGALASAAGGAPVSPEATAAGGARIPRPTVVLVIYVTGILFLTLRLAIQQLAARRLIARADDVHDAAWAELLGECALGMHVTRRVQLRRAQPDVMPMAAGIRQPVILIPAVADEWTGERRRAVLLHEMAHIARHDCLTQLLAAVVCTAYWPHPGVWWAARRLRIERELACDDLVLRAGTEARDYAGHLLEIAYSLGGQRAPSVAVSMARPGQLEGRMLAVLDAARNRAIPGFRGRLAGIAVAAAVVLPLAAAAAASSAVPLAADADLVSTSDVAIAAARQTTPRGAGTWEVSPSKSPGLVHLQMREDGSSSGTTVPLSGLEGLSEAQMSGSGTAVRFAVRRDAGTFAFEGTFRSGVGGGTYTFAPNPAFPQDLQKRGVGTPSSDQQRDMARHDVGLALVDELHTHGYQRPTVADLIKAGHHGVRVAFVREMAQLGYKLGTVEALIRLRDHGVTPDYVRGMAAEGLPKMSADELVRTRDHGVTPEYVQQMRQLGYGNLGVEALVKARDHGVTPEFVKALSDLGYKVTLPELVNARDHGVTPAYARELKALGYDNVPLAELVTLRDHGVTPERVKRANERAGTKLPLDMLRSLADGGMR